MTDCAIGHGLSLDWATSYGEIERVRRWMAETFPARDQGYFIGPHVAHYADDLLRDMGAPVRRTSNVFREYSIMRDLDALGIENALYLAIERSHDPDAREHLGPPSSATSIRASIAACHSGPAASFFGNAMMYAAASFSVLSVLPFGIGIGSSKGRDQPRDSATGAPSR